MRELLSRIWKKDEGFSLIELIIVIAILAIIAAIAIPNLMNNIDNANQSTDESNAKIIADAVLIAIGNEPSYQTVAVSNVAFSVTASPSTPLENLINDAIDNVTGAVAPLQRSDVNGTSGDPFYVTLNNTTGSIVVAREAAGTNVVYPAP